MISSQFQTQFNDWLNRALSQPIPPSVVAFNFNLAEPWCIQLIGADTYNENDEEWACVDSFASQGADFDLPESQVGSDWETVLKSSVKLIENYLQTQSSGSAILKSAMAVTVGFVDGNLTRILPK